MDPFSQDLARTRVACHTVEATSTNFAGGLQHTATEQLRNVKDLLGMRTLSGREEHPDLVVPYRCDGERKQHNVSTLVRDRFAREDNPYGGWQICSYDLRQLVWFGGFVAGNARGSVFRDAEEIKKWFLLQCLVFVILTLSWHLAWPDGNIRMYSIDKMEKYLNGMVPLLLGLYLELSLWRWWALRSDACGTLCDCITEIASLASTFIPYAEATNHVRESVCRWGMASLYLITEAARKRDASEIAVIAVQTGVLSAKEVAGLEGVHPYVQAMVMWSWIARAMNDNLLKSSGPEPYANFLFVALNVCVKARNSLQVLHTYMMTALPFSYVHLVSLTVDVTTMVITLKCSLVCANALGEEPTNWQAFVYELLHFVFVPVMYHGLLSVTYIIHDPFGEELADFPMCLLMECQAQVTDAVRRADERFPRRDLNAMRGSTGPIDGTEQDGEFGESKAVATSREVARQAAAHMMADVTRDTLKVVRASLTNLSKELNLLVQAVDNTADEREQATTHLVTSVDSGKQYLPPSSVSE